MRTRVQRRVLYSESAQVKLGEGRGRFNDKKTRVGPAYQAVIPVLGSCSNADETARAGYVQAQEECPPKTRQTTTSAPPIYQHTVLHNDPMVAAQLREVRIATSTVRQADSTRKRTRAASTSHSAKRPKRPDLVSRVALSSTRPPARQGCHKALIWTYMYAEPARAA
eukprot:COSAG02_NODE_5451_length_4305_cov_438.317166_2_plen_167_part_00